MTTWTAPAREDTQAVGRRLAASLRAGDVILLSGRMGAGKSEFARGVARGLGIACAVPSPSFTILNVYDEGRLPLYHFDWYRVSDPEEIAEMGFEEQLHGDGVSLIEWSERAPEYVPNRALIIRIDTAQDDTREIHFEPRGGFPFTEEQML